MKKSNRRIQNSDMYRAILTLKTEEECKAFFTDLCSITELMAMEQRYEVAKLLNEGLIYNIIMERSGTSSAIISRVNRSLQYGSGGYGIVFSRLYGEKKEDGEEEPKD